MRDCKLEIENEIIVEFEVPETGGYRLFIPKDVVGFDNEAIIGVNADSIEVEPGNPVFIAKNNCLIEKSENTLVLACKNSRIPDDGSVTAIGANAFAYSVDLTEMELNPLRIPDSVKRIEYRAFAFSSEHEIQIIVPESVEFVGEMAFMLRSSAERIRVSFEGSPELAPGVFGTKAEAADSDNEAYKALPEIIYTNPKDFVVSASPASSVAAYCGRYGISVLEV